MTIAKSALLTELNYTIWANTVLLEVCAELTEEELRLDLGASHGSVIRTLRHLYDAERSWIHSLMTDSIPSVAELEAAGAADQSRPDPTFEFLRQSWPKVWDEAHQWVEPLDDKSMARELPFLQPDGSSILLPRWKVMLHMVNHATQHRGQIITLLRQLGKRPRNLDLLTFYRLHP